MSSQNSNHQRDGEEPNHGIRSSQRAGDQVVVKKAANDERQERLELNTVKAKRVLCITVTR